MTSITSNVLEFVDDTKVFGRVNNDGDKQHLQNLVKWSEKWQILLHFGKCKCPHIGNGNLDENDKMGDTVLGTTINHIINNSSYAENTSKQSQAEQMFNQRVMCKNTNNTNTNSIFIIDFKKAFERV